MATVRVHGAREREPGESELQRGLGKAVTIKHAVRMPAMTMAAAAPVDLTGVEKDDVLEIELEDGIRVWMRVEDAARELNVRARGVADTEDVIELPASLPLRRGTRLAGITGGAPGARGIGASRAFGFDVGSFAIKALKILGIDISTKISTFVVEKVEARLSPGPGLYRCNASPLPSDQGALTPIGDLGGSGPVLVFLHGTASSTQGAFAGLWNAPDPVMAQLVQRYERRVLG